MKDPVFGNLEYEYGWNGTVEFNCFGRREEIALTVSGEEDDPITDYQHPLQIISTILSEHSWRRGNGS